MNIYKDIYMVGSGYSGFSISNENDCTVYLVATGHDRCVLIDTGMGLETNIILQNMKDDGFSPESVEAILLTHGHGDHSGGARDLYEATNAPVYALSPTDQFVTEGDIKKLSLDGAINAGIFHGNVKYQKCQVKMLREESSITFGNKMFEIIRTEGHCNGHAAYLLKINEKKILFSGDSVFTDGKISLQSIWDCSITKYMETIRKLSKLDIDILLPGHGTFALSEGKMHIRKALAAINNLKLPENL